MQGSKAEVFKHCLGINKHKRAYNGTYLLKGCPNLKRLYTALFVLIIAYVIYIDFTKGTLPKENKPKSEQVVSTSSSVNSIPYFERKVAPGDTVLTIVEEHLDQALPVSISQVIADFQTLNNGQEPEEIVIGKHYRFPDYQKFD